MCDAWQSRRSRSRYNWSIFKKFPGHKPLIKDLERLFIFNASGMSGRHGYMFSLRWNSSNPSKSTRTSSGFSSKLFQTSSSMCCLGKYSDRIKSSLRLRLLAVLKLPNKVLRRKQHQNGFWYLTSLWKLYPMPSLWGVWYNTMSFRLLGRPTVKTFLLSTLRRSSCFSVVSFRRVTLDKL